MNAMVCAGVRVVQHAGLRVAGAGAHHQVGEVAAQDVVAGVAPVVPELDVDVVAPRLAEPVAGEVGVAVPALDRQPASVARRRRSARWRRAEPERWRRRGCRRVGDGAADRRLAGRVQARVQPDRRHGHDPQHEADPAAPDDRGAGGMTRAHIAVLALKPVEC